MAQLSLSNVGMDADLCVMLVWMLIFVSSMLQLRSSDDALKRQMSCIAFAAALFWVVSAMSMFSLSIAVFYLLMYNALTINAKARHSLLLITVGLMLNNAMAGFLLLVTHFSLLVALVICLVVFFMTARSILDLARLFATPTSEHPSRGCTPDSRPHLQANLITWPRTLKSLSETFKQFSKSFQIFSEAL